jgi:hypothetical protein
MFMRRIVTVFLVFISASACSLHAQDNNEIQVYGSATTPKYTTMLELHSNYAFRGPKTEVNHHPLLETLEVTTGVTKDFEFGFYIFTYTEHDKIQYTGTNIRPRVKAPESWNWPVGASLSSEIGFAIDPVTRNKDWGMEIRPILDKTIGAHYLSFNPSIGVSYTNREYLFEPNFKYAYTVSPKANLGFEYYGNTGKVFYPYSIAQQAHQLFAIVDLFLHPMYEFNFGVGRGLTESSNGWTVKCYVGRRINWKHKN